MAQNTIEFSDEFTARLDDVQINKAKSFVTNFKVDPSRIEDIYESLNYSSEIKDPAFILRDI